MYKWIVIETPCFPARWKVVYTHPAWSDNSLSLYFRDKADADWKAELLNKN